MKAATKMAIGLAGLFAAISMGTPAQAQVVVNMGGSSAATPFASIVPVTLCDAGTATQYINGTMGSITSGKLITWACTRSGLGNIIIRYSATGSSDGIKKLQQPESNSLSNMNFLDHTVFPGTCTGSPNNQSIVIGGTTYTWTQYTGCTGGPLSLPIQVGWADVGGSSFHQVGPLTTVVKPLDDSMLSVQQTATVPFSFVLGNGVQRVNPSTGAVVGRVNSLSQDQIIALVSRQVTDWRQLGLGTAPVQGDGSPAAPGTAADATSPITLCLRVAGSGTKATLQVTTLTSGAAETPNGSTTLTNAADGVYFGNSTQDIRDCIGGNPGSSRPAHPHGFGYMETDQAELLQSPGQGLVGQGYVVRMDGYLPDDPALAAAGVDRQAYLKCGKWKYWTVERFNTRIPASSDSNVVSLINAFFASATDPNSIAGMNPTWVAPSNMAVHKNADPGPILLNALPQATTACDSIN